MKPWIPSLHTGQGVSLAKIRIRIREVSTDANYCTVCLKTKQRTLNLDKSNVPLQELKWYNMPRFCKRVIRSLTIDTMVSPVRSLKGYANSVRAADRPHTRRSVTGDFHCLDLFWSCSIKRSQTAFSRPGFNFSSFPKCVLTVMTQTLAKELFNSAWILSNLIKNKHF